MMDSSFIAAADKSINFEQDSFVNEVENMIQQDDQEITEGTILERNKQKYLNLNPVK